MGRILLFSEVMPKEEDNFYFVNVTNLKPPLDILDEGLALTQDERGAMRTIRGDRLEPKQFRACIFCLVDGQIPSQKAGG